MLSSLRHFHFNVVVGLENGFEGFESQSVLPAVQVVGDLREDGALLR